MKRATTIRKNTIFLTILLVATFGCISQKPLEPSAADITAGSAVNKLSEPRKYEIIDSEIPVIYYGTVNGVYLGYQIAPHIVALKARESFYSYQKTGNESELKRALFLTEYLISNATPRDNGNIVVWEFGFDWPVYPNLSKGWIGSLAQAGVLKVLMLAHQNTGDIKYLEYGDKALKAFSVDYDEGGLKVYRVDDSVSYAWYPEYASSNPPYVLNGFATSLIWIKDYYYATKNPLAEDIFNEGIHTLIHFLPTYDSDAGSYYDAIGHNASLEYHDIHVYQMDTLFNMSGDPLFQQYYLKWKKSLVKNNGSAGNPLPTNRSFPEVWIEIHDVGANYKLSLLKKVVEILEKNSETHSKVVLMVIPNYHGKNPFHENTEFLQYLRSLQARGYILGVHGYSHIGEEFNVTRDVAEDILQQADIEFNKSGFGISEVFLPPRWSFTNESLTVATEHFERVYADNGIYISGSLLKYPVHEYTNESLDFDHDVQFEKAKGDYLKTEGVFRLSMHLAFGFSEKHLRFLDNFLKWTHEIKDAD